MGKQPPDDRARLELFCALVDEYDAIAEAFPVDQESFNFGGPPRPASDLWARMVRAVALRKFLLAESDQVHCSRVLRSLESCLDERAKEPVAAMREQFKTVAMWMQIDEGPGGTWTVPELIEDFMYGSLLHGDYDRWQRLRGRASVTREHAFWMFTADGERFVRRLRTAIALAESEGLFH